MDDEYQQAKTQENLKNPKNRFLFLFCHANEVDDSWGFGCSFASGVLMFSILIGVAVLCDMYYIAADSMFSKASGIPVFTFMFSLKVVSDLISLIGIGCACYAIYRPSYNYGIVCYYVEFLSFLLLSIFWVYSLVEMFNANFWKIVSYRVISWAFQEFFLLMFCWILFCNMVYNSRQLQLARQKAGEV